MKSDGANDGRAYQDVTGLTPGDLYTLMLWFHTAGSINRSLVEFWVEDGTGTELLRRPIGAGSANNFTIARSCNLIVPASGTLRIGMTSSATNNLELETPILVKGAVPGYAERPSVWLSSDGLITCA